MSKFRSVAAHVVRNAISKNPESIAKRIPSDSMTLASMAMTGFHTTTTVQGKKYRDCDILQASQRAFRILAASNGDLTQIANSKVTNDPLLEDGTSGKILLAFIDAAPFCIAPIAGIIQNQIDKLNQIGTCPRQVEYRQEFLSQLNDYRTGVCQFFVENHKEMASILAEQDKRTSYAKAIEAERVTDGQLAIN